MLNTLILDSRSSFSIKIFPFCLRQQHPLKQTIETFFFLAENSKTDTFSILFIREKKLSSRSSRFEQVRRKLFALLSDDLGQLSDIIFSLLLFFAGVGVQTYSSFNHLVDVSSNFRKVKEIYPLVVDKTNIKSLVLSYFFLSFSRGHSKCLI